MEVSLEPFLSLILIAINYPQPSLSNESLLATPDENAPNSVVSPEEVPTSSLRSSRYLFLTDEEEAEADRLREQAAVRATQLCAIKRARRLPIHSFNQWLKCSLEDRPPPEATCRMCTFAATRFVSLRTHLMASHISPAMKVTLRRKAPFDTSDCNKDLLLHLHFTVTQYESSRPHAMEEMYRFLRNYVTTPNADRGIPAARTCPSNMAHEEASPSQLLSVDLKTMYPNLFYHALFIAQECLAPHIRQNNYVCSCRRRFMTSEMRAGHMRQRNVAGTRNHFPVPRSVVPPPF